jgi:hypothetical protein
MEVGRLYRVLGTVRSDSKLLYATTAGRIQNLTTSKAMSDYAEVIADLGFVQP